MHEVRGSFYVMKDGTVKCCGKNNNGQLGIGNKTDQKKLITIPDLENVKQVSCGTNYTMFLLNDGTVKSCGLNSNGELGIDNISQTLVPTLIPDLDNVRQVVCGSNHTMFLLNDGTVKSCGLNGNYQLGFNDNENKAVPTLIPNLDSVKQIACGTYHTIFLLENKTVKVCGNNASGQCGSGSTINIITPKIISNLSNVKQVVSNYNYTIFVMEDGTVKYSGLNIYGQFGIGSGTASKIPTIIPNMKNIKQVAFGYYYTLFLLNDGTVKAAGYNYYDQFNIGNKNNQFTPVLMKDIANVQEITVGYFNNIFLLKDNTVQVNGCNESGELGIGNNTTSSKPIAVTELSTNVKRIFNTPINEYNNIEINTSIFQVHNDNVLLNGTLSNLKNLKIKYKILLNDNQIYPENDEYTALIESPYAFNYVINNSLLNDKNNLIKIILKDEEDNIIEKKITLTLFNNNPNGILQLDKTEIHKDDVNLTGTLNDSDLDKISYRILLNGNEVLPWSQFEEDPYIDYIINYKQLELGNNILKIEFKDNYKLEGMGSWEKIIKFINNNPIIENLKHESGIISCDINDSDNDLIQYNIYLNDKKVYPQMNDYTNLDMLNNIKYQLNRNDVKFNQKNTLIINVKDEFSAENSNQIIFTGEYYGLMFCDENKEYYTTDLGELIKCLDFGVINSDEITEIKKVIIQNKYGLSLKQIEITLNNDFPNIEIQLSKTKNPFIPLKELIFEKEYLLNEEEEFYVRIKSKQSKYPTKGQFEINAKGILM